MLKVDQFVQFLYDLNPQNTPVRLALYNFFKFHLSQEADMSADLLEDFFSQCLEYPHWLGNKAQLGREVLFVLQTCNQRYKRTPIDLSGIRFPQDIQVFDIENLKDLQEVSAQYIETLLGVRDRYRIVMDPNKKPLALIVRENHTCEIHQLDKKFTLRNGKLEPLRKNLVLYYDNDLHLDAGRIQSIELSPYLIAQFKVSDSRRLYGYLKRGYVFQNLTDFKGAAFHECSKLFQCVKKLEILFFDKQRDRDYQNLILALESHLDQPQLALKFEELSDVDDKKRLQALLIQAEAVLENVFTGDKPLSLLVEKFRKELVSAKQSELQNSSRA